MAFEEDEINQQLDIAKQGLDSALRDNPSFDNAFLKEVKYIYYKTDNSDIKVKISNDKKSVSLTSFSPVTDCSIPEFSGNNHSYINSKIYLNDDGNMFVEYSQGVLFDRNVLEEKGYASKTRYESKFETLYSLVCYDKYGFEYSNSSYSDSYPMKKDSSDLNVMEQTNSSFHKPTFSEYSLPMHPIHLLNASTRNMYRKQGSYSIIHANVASVNTNDGYNNVNCALYTTHYLSPKLLRGEKKIAKSVEHEGRFIFIVDKNYADTVEDGYNKAREELKEMIQKDKKEYDDETYNYLMNNI